MMRVLFIGMGSIGLRNLDSCLRVRSEYKYAALRSQTNSTDVLPRFSHLEFFYDWEHAEKFSPHLVWICNPTFLHRSTLEQVLRFRQLPAVFLEKPLAHSSEDCTFIAEQVQATGMLFFYGCLLRRHPLILRVKELLEGGVVGRSLSYSLFCGSYLPDWRPGRDYRETYSAKAEMGGGVSLDLIHEFDYSEEWFGEVLQLQGFRGRQSDFEMSADDLCMAHVFHRNGVVGQISLNYFRPEVRRDFEVIGTKGMLRGNLVTGELETQKRCTSGTGVTSEKETHVISRDDLHDRQSELVFKTVEGNSKSGFDVGAVARLNKQVLGIPILKSANRSRSL